MWHVSLGKLEARICLSYMFNTMTDAADEGTEKHYMDLIRLNNPGALLQGLLCISVNEPRLLCMGSRYVILAA